MVPKGGREIPIQQVRNGAEAGDVVAGTERFRLGNRGECHVRPTLRQLAGRMGEQCCAVGLQSEK